MSAKVVCMRCREAHGKRACARGQPVVRLLEEVALDPIDEIYARAERRGYMDDAGARELVRIAMEQLARDEGVA